MEDFLVSVEVLFGFVHVAAEGLGENADDGAFPVVDVCEVNGAFVDVDGGL